MITDSETESLASKESVENQNFSDLNLLRHQNKRLREELNIYKLKVKNLEKENRELKASKCAMQAKVEVEEEFITNSLLRQISSLKKNMENVKSKFEREEECIVAELSEKFQKLENDKILIEKMLDNSRKTSVEKLNRRIRKLEAETRSKQRQLDQLRFDKGDIQNALEQEQEALINRLWRNISQADAERIIISERIDHHANSKPFKTQAISETKKSYSLQPNELHQMTMEELTTLVVDLQKELASLQSRSSNLDPEKYQKLLKECNILDETHWIKQKFPADPNDASRLSTVSSESISRESFSEFKHPNSKS